MSSHMDHPHCQQFGFDKDKIEQRLAFLLLNRNDHKLARRLHDEVIRPNVDKVIEQFYQTLLFTHETRAWLLDGEVIDRLKHTQRDYLLGLGLNFDSPDYFETRLHIGAVHARIKLPLNTYLSSYSILNQYIISSLPDMIAIDPIQMRKMIKFLYKITALDMSLAVEAYHSANMMQLEDTVEQLHSRVEFDSLTEVYNRDTVFRKLQAMYRAECKTGHALHILMVDVDHFKQVNDEHGHPVGDRVLKQIAQILAHALREHDLIGRYGGEEFILALPHITPAVCAQVAERVRQQVEQTPIVTDEQSFHVTVSIGLTQCEKYETLEQAVQRADAALYAAKRNGRNCVVRQ